MSSDDDIEAIRTSLGLDAHVEEEVHRVGQRLLGEIEGWAERFYVRLIGDPAAMRILGDEGRVVRLKRSLAAWFAEIFSLPFDRTYQLAREQIGRAHVRIGMPQHLMVTSMNGVRRDVAASIERIWRGDPAGARRALEAVDRALDLELALMLAAYRRRSREVWQQAERSIVASHLQQRLSNVSRQAVDAARCYAELVRRTSSEHDRSTWATRLTAVLDGLAWTTGAPSGPAPARTRVELRALCEGALAEVSLPPHTWLDLSVEPQGLEADVHHDALAVALQDLAQRAVNRGAGAAVRVSLQTDGDALRIEVVDSGAAATVEHAGPSGVAGVAADAWRATCEYVVNLHGGTLDPFELPDGREGVRLRLPGAVDADRD